MVISSENVISSEKLWSPNKVKIFLQKKIYIFTINKYRNKKREKNYVKNFDLLNNKSKFVNIYWKFWILKKLEYNYV